MIRNLEEKRGGIRRLDPLSTNFNEVIEDFHLENVIAKKCLHIWNNNRVGLYQVASHLDRFHLTKSIILKDKAREANILPSTGLNH